MVRNATRAWLAPALAGVALLAISCAPEQLRSVERFNEQAGLLQVACLDVNDDGKVDSGDADPALLPDVTGDGRTDEEDTAIVENLALGLPSGRPVGCDEGRGPDADWQISEPPELDCLDPEAKGVLLLAMGGGAANLRTLDNAAGARWMVEELSGELDMPKQIASVAPGLNGTANPQPDSEEWTFSVLSQELQARPCMKVMLLGHSHGGALATSVAARLEEAGLAEQILLTVLVDRVTELYGGNSTSLPQSSLVFNIYLQPKPGEVVGRAIDQENVENLDASGLLGPERGEEGGDLTPVTHTTIDNSEDVWERVALAFIKELGAWT
jgi:hypothetical protein